MDVSPDRKWVVLCVARVSAMADVATWPVPANDNGPALFLRVARQRFVAKLESLSANGGA